MTENTRPAVESHDPKVPAAWSAFMRSGWGDRELDLPAHPITPYAAARRAPAGRHLPRRAAGDPGRRLQGPRATTPTTASAPTPRTPTCAATRPPTRSWSIDGGEATLFARPRSSRETDEFFRDRQYGELWAGRRPSLHEISDSLGLACRHIDDLPAALAGSGKTRVLRGVDARVDAPRRR